MPVIFIILAILVILCFSLLAALTHLPRVDMYRLCRNNANDTMEGQFAVVIVATHTHTGARKRDKERERERKEREGARESCTER